MMTFEIDAVYEQGVLKLEGVLPFRDGEKVRLVIRSEHGSVARLTGLIAWRGPPEELARYLHDADEGLLGLPDDDITREWLEHIRQYRAECDKLDKERLLDRPENL